jgi:acyl carrier protein
MNDIGTSLREFIKENFLFGADDPFSDGDSLLEHGIIDSTGVLELIMHLEDTYGMSVEDAELLPENLDSIDNLKRFIAGKCPAAVGA